MRVATANLLHGRSLVDGIVDIERMAEAIVNLDADNDRTACVLKPSGLRIARLYQFYCLHPKSDPAVLLCL